VVWHSSLMIESPACSATDQPDSTSVISRNGEVARPALRLCDKLAVVLPDETDRARVESVLASDNPGVDLQVLAAPFELHLLALRLNWDDAFDVPLRILGHPGCDRGTALQMFWLAEPAEWELIASGRRDGSWALEDVEKALRTRGAQAHIEFVNECRRRLLDPAGFASEMISTEVVTDHLVPNRGTRRRFEIAGVPVALLGPTRGSPFPRSFGQ